MKIQRMDLKRGIVQLVPENLDDLHHLERVLKPSDIVRARTRRRKKIYRDGQTIYGDRKPTTLTVKIEKIKPEAASLRLTGKIERGPPDVPLGSHHTIQVEPGTVLKIKKPWKTWQLDRLKKACVKKPLLLFCVLDRERADFAGLKETGIDWLGSKYFKKVKGEEEKRNGWYREITAFLEKEKKYEHIIIAGPGFERENLFNFIKEKNKKLSEKVFLEHASCIGKAGIQEVIKKSANKILKQASIARETVLVEELFKGIKEGGPVVYGPEETEKAANVGAIKTLLISDQKISDFEDLMNLVEKKRGEVRIVSSEHQSGQMFLNLGGVAGFLRFRV